MVGLALSAFESELLELCAQAPYMGETTTTLCDSMLKVPPARDVLEPTLRGLVDRGLMTTSRGTFGGEEQLRDGRVEHRVYEDDWWIVTDTGRAAIGLPPKKKRTWGLWDNP